MYIGREIGRKYCQHDNEMVVKSKQNIKGAWMQITKE